MERKVMVSVCMITYNHANFIRSAIEGVLNQIVNFDLKLIIGEDYSSDTTLLVCQKYAKQHPNKINLISSERNLGSIQNFIRTLKACEGNYIALCEGDDYWIDPFKLQKQIDFLEANSDIGLVYSRFEAHDMYDNLIGVKEIDRWEGHVFFAMQEKPIVSTLTTVVRREALMPLVERVINENLWFVMDIWFWQQISLKWGIYGMDEVTSVYRVHPGGITKVKNALHRKGAFIVIDVFITFFCMNHLKVSCKNKLLISEQFVKSLIIILIDKRGMKFRKAALKAFFNKPWLLFGIMPAFFGIVNSQMKKFLGR